MATPLLEVSGVGPASAKLLTEHGINSAEELAGAKPGTVMAIPGFSEVRASRVMAAAKLLANVEPAATGKKPAKKDAAEAKTSTKKARKKKAKQDKAKKSEKKDITAKDKSQKKTKKAAKVKKAEKKKKKTKANKKSGKSK